MNAGPRARTRTSSRRLAPAIPTRAPTNTILAAPAPAVIEDRRRPSEPVDRTRRRHDSRPGWYRYRSGWYRGRIRPCTPHASRSSQGARDRDSAAGLLRRMHAYTLSNRCGPGSSRGDRGEEYRPPMVRSWPQHRDRSTQSVLRQVRPGSPPHAAGRSGRPAVHASG